MKHSKGAQTVATTTFPAYLTAAEVGAVLRVTPERVRQLAATGQIPAIRLGPRGSWRFDAAAVERFLEGKSP